MRTVQEVMATNVRTVSDTAVVGTLRDVMVEERMHGIPVLDAHGTLVGIVTSTDLVEEWDSAMGVTTVMSTDVRSVSPHTTVVDAARVMLDNQIHHLVVTRGTDIAGLVSSFDLLKELAGAVEAHESKPVAARLPAAPGDIVVIRGHAIGRAERRGVIVETRGPDGGPPYIVQWLDDPRREPHDVLFFPGSDADIESPIADDVATVD